jgi:hypothetical protein
MPSFKVFLVAYLSHFIVLNACKTRSARNTAWSVQSFVPYVFCLQISAGKAIFGYPLGVAVVQFFVTSLVSLSLVFIEMYIMLIILILLS